ncbi:MAG: helix-turn-helix transcriptional regulator [Proteobacteria bacterium]|nr:helix-turn-helix transcriptional regulator [Pseudomonadota bacterium]
MRLYLRDPNVAGGETGAQYFRSQEIGGELFDIVFINNGDCLVSVLVPLQTRHTSQLDYFATFGLTKRELEVVDLVIKGKTNSEIARTLCISKATLKTHLNRVYRKIPGNMVVAWRSDAGDGRPRDSHVRLSHKAARSAASSEPPDDDEQTA